MMSLIFLQHLSQSLTEEVQLDFLLPFYRTSETFVIRKEVPLPWMLFLNTLFISTWICQTKFVDDRSLQSDSNEMMSLAKYDPCNEIQIPGYLVDLFSKVSLSATTWAELAGVHD